MSRMRRLFALAALLTYVAFAPAPIAGVSNTVVISQIYGGGGNAGSTFKNDFIELYNRGAVAVSLNGWSVQYASAAGNFTQVTALGNFNLQPGQYFLVQEAVGAGGTVNLPPPDATGTIPMSATAGKIALVSSTVALGNTGCPINPAVVVDLVGYGTGTTCVEGTGPTPAPSPSIATQGGAITFTLTAKPGENPASVSMAAKADLTPIGGAALAPFTSSGFNGTGEEVFTLTTTVGAAITQGPKSISVTLSDN